VFEVSLKGTKFIDNEIFSSFLADQDKVDDPDSFYVNQKEVNKAVYDKAYKQYFADLTKVSSSKVITTSFGTLFNDNNKSFVPNGIANFINRYSSAK